MKVQNSIVKTLSKKIRKLFITAYSLAFALYISVNSYLISRDFHSMTDQNMLSLGAALENPLWDFGTETAKKIVDAFFASPDITSIRVMDYNGEVFTESNSPETAMVPVIMETNLTKNGKKIGVIKVTFKMDLVLEKFLLNILLTLLVSIVAVYALMMLLNRFLNEKVVAPLIQLEKNAQQLHLGNLSTPFHWSEGDEIHSVGLVMEHSRKKILSMIETLEHQIQERSSQVVQAEKMASLGEMASGVAHEINNPLAIISGKARMIRSMIENGTTSSNEIILHIDRINYMVDRITKIIHGLRLFSRKGNSLELHDLNASKLVEECLELCIEKFKKHEIDIIFQASENMIVRANMVQLSQVYINLINNSFDALLETKNPRWIKIWFEKTNQNMIQYFQDSGSGIAPEIVGKIMQPFFTTKEIGKGTGLGLSISKGMIESFNGTFEYVTLDKHTTFKITLPLLETKILSKAS